MQTRPTSGGAHVAWVRIAVGGCMAMACLANASAQVSPGVPSIAVPPEVSPGVLQQQLRPTIPPPPNDAQPFAAPAPEAPAIPPGAAQRMLNVRAVEITGNSAIPTGELQAAWAGMPGREQPASEAYELAAALTRLYRNRGYVLSSVVVPPDLVSAGLPADGVLRLKAIEGYVGEVSFDPELPAASRIRAEAEKISAERPLSIATLERQLLLINDISGVTAQAYFSPGAAPGEARMRLAVARRAVTGFVGVQNRVSKLLGHALIEGRVSLNNALGLDDSHTLLLQTTDRGRLRSAGYAYDQPLGTDGLALNVFLGHVESKTSIPAADLLAFGRIFDEQVRSESNIANIGLSYPLIRSRSQSLKLRARFSAYNGKQSAFAAARQDDVRALRLGAGWDRSDSLGGVNFADGELSRGFTGLGATDNRARDAIRADADYGFTKFNFTAGRLQQLGGPFSLLASLQGQWTRDRLPASERAALGGDLILRSFNAGELIGDRMWAGKLEVRYDTPWLPTGRMTLYGFGEVGRTTSIEVAPTPNLVAKGASTGIGVRGSLANGASFYAELTKPHQRNVAQNNSRRPRFFAGVSYQF